MWISIMDALNTHSSLRGRNKQKSHREECYYTIFYKFFKFDILIGPSKVSYTWRIFKTLQPVPN